MKYSIPVLFLTFLPVVLRAQGTTIVQHITSKDYEALVRDSSARQPAQRKDASDLGQSSLRSATAVHPFISIGRISRSNDVLRVYPAGAYQIMLLGDYTTTIAFKTVNRQPALQSLYAQGRSVNGALAWQGAEADEPFSYGPDIHLLEFDGSAYPYDRNGKLVPAGSGNGSKAGTYSNGIFRTGTLFSQSFHLNGQYIANNRNALGLDLKLGRSNERTVIKGNDNNSKYLTTDITVPLKWLEVKAKYNYLEDWYSNYNRNGFLNRLYQGALLTPATFDNSQGTTLGSAQRSYSSTTDNPLFLLENNGHYFKRRQHNAGLTLAKIWGGGRIALTQSLEKVNENSNESYRPGTVAFQDGFTLLRSKRNQTYYLQLNGAQELWDAVSWRGSLSGHYIFTDARSTVGYAPVIATYNYQRSSQEMQLSHKASYDIGNLEVVLEAGNRFYISNTARSNSWFLPLLTGYLKVEDIMDRGYLSVSTSYNRFNSELPVNRSLAHVNLMRYTTAQAAAFLPFPEVTGFDGLDAIGHKEWSAAITFGYAQHSLTATAFVRDSRNDVFPVYRDGRLELQNVASHRNRGWELMLNTYSNIYRRDRKLNWATTLSLLAYQDKVTGVREGYDFTPLAGFSNVHKALVQGASIGAIVGNTYRRDAAGNILIGSDGFPLTDEGLKVIGNAIPDFVLKGSQRLQWRGITLQIDMEWKKGGDTWNGTQAMLDYYGRSENSALQRNTKGHVFSGVLEDGHVNNIPVDFYDPAAPFSQNRWVRYGPGGVAEDYIQRADHLRINMAELGYGWSFDGFVQKLSISGYVNNILLWSAYDGVDPNQLLYDQPNAAGLDFFNLPSVKTFGCNISIQF